MGRVIDTDLGWNALMRSMTGAKTTTAYVGPDPQDFAADGQPYYALWVEFGTSRGMAARPFVRFTLDAHDDYRAEIKTLAGRVIDRAKDGHLGLSLVASLKGLAESVAKDIKTTIIGLGAIDTGRLLRSVKVLRITEGDDGGGAMHVEWGK